VSVPVTCRYASRVAIFQAPRADQPTIQPAMTVIIAQVGMGGICGALAMKPEPRPSLLHRIPDATASASFLGMMDPQPADPGVHWRPPLSTSGELRSEARRLFDYGPAVAVYPNGNVDPQHNSEMELKLQDGAFRLNIAGIEKTFFAHVERQPAYSATCSHFQSFASTVPIVAGSGTGAYRSITGSFEMNVTADEVQSKPCTPPISKPPLWEVIVLAGSGTVTT
jgi:hypothetical protein